MHLTQVAPTGSMVAEWKTTRELCNSSRLGSRPKAGAPYGGRMRGKALASTRVLIADKADTKPLPDSQGPLRLVVPSDRVGARSVRRLIKIEVVRLRK